MTREFDFYFLPSEVGDLSEIVVPPGMIVVCKELADEDMLTLFNLNQALQYSSVGGMYFRSDLSSIPRKRLSRSDGSQFFVVDDLSLPEHLGLFAGRPSLPALTRVSISLMSGFSSGSGWVSPSLEITDAFTSIRAAIKSRAASFKVNGLNVLVSNAARDEIIAGTANTGDEALNKVITNAGAR